MTGITHCIYCCTAVHKTKCPARKNKRHVFRSDKYWNEYESRIQEQENKKAKKKADTKVAKASK